MSKRWNVSRVSLPDVDGVSGGRRSGQAARDENPMGAVRFRAIVARRQTLDDRGGGERVRRPERRAMGQDLMSVTASPNSMPRALFGYELIEALGDGAGSRIYAAVHPQTRQLCAVKHVVCKTDKDQRFVEQLK